VPGCRRDEAVATDQIASTIGQREEGPDPKGVAKAGNQGGSPALMGQTERVARRTPMIRYTSCFGSKRVAKSNDSAALSTTLRALFDIAGATPPGCRHAGNQIQSRLHSHGQDCRNQPGGARLGFPSALLSSTRVNAPRSQNAPDLLRAMIDGGPSQQRV